MQRLRNIKKGDIILLDFNLKISDNFLTKEQEKIYSKLIKNIKEIKGDQLWKVKTKINNFHFNFSTLQN